MHQQPAGGGPMDGNYSGPNSARSDDGDGEDSGKVTKSQVNDDAAASLDASYSYSIDPKLTAKETEETIKEDTNVDEMKVGLQTKCHCLVSFSCYSSLNIFFVLLRTLLFFPPP